MEISRHYLTIAGRRVHYRRAGSGPPLLMVHQSPRSSAEYEPLMRAWASDFTCIAPDTPGFGQSDALLGDTPDISDFADALAEFVGALGLNQVAAYGFHSGGIILVTALRRHPALFSALAVGGYAIWTAEEMALFGTAYLPPFHPLPYGQHLAWLWHRVLEQSWFFPWFDTRDAARLSVAHADPARVHGTVMDMLDAGNAYAAGYGAVLRAPRDIPPVDTVTCPVLISAYDGDPLQAHIDRLGPLPAGWRAKKVATPADHQLLSLDFLRQYPAPVAAALASDADAGFVPVQTDRFSGLIHYLGSGETALLAPPGSVLVVPPPGGGAELVARPGLIAIDPPGHGHSSGWPGAPPTDYGAWAAVVEAAAAQLGCTRINWPAPPPGDPAALFPDLTPDRFGAYLHRAWGAVRAATCFAPWYASDAAHATALDPAALDPAALALRHRALIRASAAREFAAALQMKGS